MALVEGQIDVEGIVPPKPASEARVGLWWLLCVVAMVVAMGDCYVWWAKLMSKALYLPRRLPVLLHPLEGIPAPVRVVRREEDRAVVGLAVGLVEVKRGAVRVEVVARNQERDDAPERRALVDPEDVNPKERKKERKKKERA